MNRVLLKQIAFFICILTLVACNVTKITASTSLRLNSSNDKTQNEQFKIKFYVTDSFSSNLSDVEFLVFASKNEATEFLKTYVKKGQIETLTSSNGVVLSKSFYNPNKEYFIVQSSKDEKHSNNVNIYTFNSNSEKKYLTEKTTEKNGNVTYTKVILENNIVWIDKYKIKVAKTDSYNDKISGVVFNIYSTKSSADKAAEQINKGNAPTTENLVESLKKTDGLGVSISNSYFSAGTYYLVETNKLDSRYNSIIVPVSVIISGGPKDTTIEKVFLDGSNSYVKKVAPYLTKSDNNYRLKVVDVSTRNESIYYIFDSKDKLNSFKANTSLKNYLEKISVTNGVYNSGTNFYKAGTYYIYDSTSSKSSFTLKLDSGSVADVERSVYSNDSVNPFFYTKIFSKEPLAALNVKNPPSSNNPMPLNPPNTTPILKNSLYSVYKDNLYGRYVIFDENNIPIGYLKLNDNESIYKYDVMKNLTPFYAVKTNPRTLNEALVNTLWILLILSGFTINKFIKGLKRNRQTA